MQSGAIASRLRAVSSKVSPLVTHDVDALMLMASAERRFAAIFCLKRKKKAAIAGRLSRLFRCGSLHDGDAFLFIKILEHHFDDLTFFRRHDLAYVIRLNRQLSVLLAPVNQNGKLHAARS